MSLHAGVSALVPGLYADYFRAKYLEIERLELIGSKG
jgi:hypothetical protein